MDTRLISESAFEYMLREILTYEAPESEDEAALALAFAGSGRVGGVLRGGRVVGREPRQTHAQRLEAMGQDVGHRIVDRMTEKQKFLGFEDMDYVKFICRDFWEGE